MGETLKRNVIWLAIPRRNMKIQILASIVLFLGALYLAEGIWALRQYRSMSQTFAEYGVSVEIQMSVPEIAKARGRLIAGAIEFPLIGIVLLCTGAGLHMAKSWARNVWRGSVIVLAVFHVVRLFQDFQLDTLTVLMRVVEVLFIGSLAVISWLWLFARSSAGNGAKDSRAI
jgi:hypothetical protein